MRVKSRVPILTLSIASFCCRVSFVEDHELVLAPTFLIKQPVHVFDGGHRGVVVGAAGIRQAELRSLRCRRKHGQDRSQLEQCF